MIRRRSTQSSEAGASLILALAMVTLISVASVAALGFATASLRTVTVIGTQRATAYAADGAVQTAIQTLRTDATAGTTAVGTACPSTTYAAAGIQPAAAVSCQVSQSYSPGGASVPPYSIWAVGNNAAEAGISINAATYGPLKVVAPIASNSPATGTNGINSVAVTGGTLDLSGYTIDAKGTCTGTITTTTPATDKRCSTGTSYADPAYPSQTPPALTSPNPSPTCSVADGVLQFSPGYYTNTAILENPDYSPGSGPLCKTGYLYFQPGVYYFDFGFDATYPDNVWNVTQEVVGGQPKGWDPTTKTLPNQPNPGDSASIACKTASDGATDGVQFIFGGASQMNVTATGGIVELCPDPAPTGTNQQIAIYGQRTGTAPVTNLTQVPKTTATQTPASSWTNPLNTSPISPSLTTIDGKYGSNPIATAATETLSLNGYVAPVPLIPSGAVNVSAVIKIAHSESVASAATNVKSLTAYIGSTTSGCSFAAIPHTTTTSTVTLSTDTINIPTSSACIAALSSNFSVIYTSVAATSKTFTENLDGIDVVASYTMPAVEAENGCTIVINSCSVINVGGTGGQAKFVSWGTVYVPLGSVNADVNGASVVTFRRGVIARAVMVPHIPSGATLYYCLNSGSPCAAPPPATNLPRALLLTATVSGVVELRALVQYVDTPAVGTSLQILSWNVIRGG